jgi:hypothetical protein
MEKGKSKKTNNDNIVEKENTPIFVLAVDVVTFWVLFEKCN